MDYTEVIIRLMLSIIIGGMIGYEREFKHKTAGFRTHILVCVGAAVISMIQLYSINSSLMLIENYPNLKGVLTADTGRLGAQVISGVGFLGAGAIIQDRGLIRGLTTAASLWVVACIGLAVGLGYYTLSLLAVVSVFLTLVLLKKFETRLFIKPTKVQLQVDYVGKKDIIPEVIRHFNDRNINLINIETLPQDKVKNLPFDSVVYTLILPRNISIHDLKEELYNSLNIINVKVL